VYAKISFFSYLKKAISDFVRYSETDKITGFIDGKDCNVNFENFFDRIAVIDDALEEWGYEHKSVCHSHGEYARDEDGDGFCEVHVNTTEGFWWLLRSWLRPHRGISQEKLPNYLGFFEFVHNAKRRGRALLGSLLDVLLQPVACPQNSI